MVIKIHAVGEATNIAIFNTGTREVFRLNTDKMKTLTGSVIIDGDDIIINTVKGQKSITYSVLERQPIFSIAWRKVLIGFSWQKAIMYSHIRLKAQTCQFKSENQMHKCRV